MKRREFNLGACASLLALAPSARAQAWPAKPVRLIVPFAAGSSPDTANRVFANELGQALGQPVVIDNRPGANGITGTIAGLSSPADGYTLISVNVGTLAINPFLFPKQKYEPLADLVPIALTASTANVLVVRPTLAARTMAELVAYGKANPGKLSMGSSGTGTTGHLSGELFKELTGLFAVHVPYKGSSAAYTDLLAGRIDFMFDNLVSVGPYAKDGRVRVLAVTSAQRSELLPQTPTLQEAGLKGYETVSWGGVAVPKGTPVAVVQTLKNAVEKANASPASLDFYRQTGAKPLPSMTDEQFTRFVLAEQQKWSALVRRSGAANT